MHEDVKSIRSGRLNRRQLLKTTAAGAALSVGTRVAPAAAAPSVRDRFGAHYQAAKTIKLGLTTDDQPKVQPLLDAYAKANNVTIQTDTAAYDAYYSKLNLNLSTQTGAYDVVSLDDPWMPQFAGGEFLMNLDDLLSKKGQKVDPDFIGALIALGDFPKGSGHRGIPWVGNVQVFCYRTDVLDELKLKVPATWDDVLANAQAISDAKKASGLSGYGCRGKTGNSANTSFLPVLRGYGGDVFKTVDFSDGDYTPQLTTDAAMAAIKTHLALAKLTPPGVENTDHATNGRNMYSGLTAASGDIWPDQLLQIFDPSISKVADKVKIGAEPAQAGVPNKDMTGNWLLGIPNGSKNADAALEFILWFTAPEQQKKLLLEHQIPATRTSVMQDKDAVAKFSFLPGLLAAGQNAVPRPRTELYPQIDESILGVYIAQAIAGQISGEQALKKANDDITALMKREGKIK